MISGGRHPDMLLSWRDIRPRAACAGSVGARALSEALPGSLITFWMCVTPPLPTQAENDDRCWGMYAQKTLPPSFLPHISLTGRQWMDVDTPQHNHARTHARPHRPRWTCSSVPHLQGSTSAVPVDPGSESSPGPGSYNQNDTTRTGRSLDYLAHHGAVSAFRARPHQTMTSGNLDSPSPTAYTMVGIAWEEWLNGSSSALVIGSFFDCIELYSSMGRAALL